MPHNVYHLIACLLLPCLVLLIDSTSQHSSSTIIQPHSQIFFLPSVVQLLEPGVELLFAALFAYLLRHRRLSKNHLAAFGVAFLAMLIVAACDATHFREETFDPFIEYEGAGSFASYTTTRSPSLSPTVSSVPSAANRSMPSSQSPSFTYNRFSSFVYRDAFIHTRGDEASITQRSDVHAASPIYTHTDMPSHISSRTTMNTHTDGDLPNQESPRRRYRQDKTNNADIDAHVRVDVVKMSAALMLVLLQTMFAALKDTLSEFLLQEKRIRINGLLYCGLEGLYTLVFGGCLVGSFFLFLHTTASASAQVPGQGVLATATANCTIGNITGGTFDNDSAGVGVIMDGMSHLSAIFARISSDVLLASFLSVYALIVLMMNLFNTFSIKRNSAVTRCMWKCLRVLGVWLVELIVHCLVPAVSIPSSSAPPPSSSSSSPSYTHPNVLEFGEGWSGQSFAKLVGLILIVIAMYIYYLGKGQ